MQVFIELLVCVPGPGVLLGAVSTLPLMGEDRPQTERPRCKTRNSAGASVPSCSATRNPLGTKEKKKKSSSDSSWSFQHLCLALGQIPRPAPHDPPQQACGRRVFPWNRDGAWQASVSAGGISRLTLEATSAIGLTCLGRWGW